MIGLEGVPSPNLPVAHVSDISLRVVKLPVAHAGMCATGKLGGNKIQFLKKFRLTHSAPSSALRVYIYGALRVSFLPNFLNRRENFQTFLNQRQKIYNIFESAAKFSKFENFP
jgi:hypothetical protein